jgi:anti-sigma regulatory factor (Ser/Thr protein kinase)
MLTAFAEVLDLDPQLLNDVKTAVSEACNNVVLHAYDGECGPLTVSVAASPGAIEVLTRDRGGGLQQIIPSPDRMGIGLAVIRALAEGAEFQALPAGGTEVQMSFARDVTVPPLPRGQPRGGLDNLTVELSGDVVVTLTPSSLLACMLPRISRAVAAHSHFTVERVSDLDAVAEAIATRAERGAAGESIRFSIHASSRRLVLTVGPLRQQATSRGAAGESADGARAPLAALVDELAVERVNGYELLHVVIVDHWHRN